MQALLKPTQEPAPIGPLLNSQASLPLQDPEATSPLLVLQALVPSQELSPMLPLLVLQASLPLQELFPTFPVLPVQALLPVQEPLPMLGTALGAADVPRDDAKLPDNRISIAKNVISKISPRKKRTVSRDTLSFLF